MLCITALACTHISRRPEWSRWSQWELPDQGKLQMGTGVSREARFGQMLLLCFEITDGTVGALELVGGMSSQSDGEE